MSYPLRGAAWCGKERSSGFWGRGGPRTIQKLTLTGSIAANGSMSAGRVRLRPRCRVLARHNAKQGGFECRRFCRWIGVLVAAGMFLMGHAPARAQEPGPAPAPTACAFARFSATLLSPAGNRQASRSNRPRRLGLFRRATPSASFWPNACAHNGVGIVVGILEPGGRRVISALRQAPAPVTSALRMGDTIYQIGSVTKVFTDAAAG